MKALPVALAFLLGAGTGALLPRVFRRPAPTLPPPPGRLEVMTRAEPRLTLSLPLAGNGARDAKGRAVTYAGSASAAALGSIAYGFPTGAVPGFQHPVVVRLERLGGVRDFILEAGAYGPVFADDVLTLDYRP
ncbi:MAG TPA: hypothetical protein VK188_12565 [Holophaga sp.]|nr:hypothetical protein [Holophaga sp.]